MLLSCGITRVRPHFKPSLENLGRVQPPRPGFSFDVVGNQGTVAIGWGFSARAEINLKE